MIKTPSLHLQLIRFKRYRQNRFWWRPYWIWALWRPRRLSAFLSQLNHQSMPWATSGPNLVPLRLISVKISLRPGTIGEILSIQVIILVKSNYADYENCSTYESQHPAVSTCWGPILNISNIKLQGTQNFRVHILANRLFLAWMDESSVYPAVLHKQ